MGHDSKGRIGYSGNQLNCICSAVDTINRYCKKTSLRLLNHAQNKMLVL